MATSSTPARAATKPAIKPESGPRKPDKPATLKTPVDVLALLMNGGQYDWVVHLKGCKSYKAQKAKSAYAGLEEDYEIPQVINQRDVIMDAWGDQIAESYAADDKVGDDYAEASWAWLSKNGYVTSVSFHGCLEGLPQSSKAAAKAANAENVKKATKQELATRVALKAAELLDGVFAVDENEADASTDPAFATALLAAFGTEDAARQCVAQWMHGMPVDRDRWYRAGLPIPQRSDWSDYQPPADVPATEE